MQWRERAIREKQTAERAKNTADSQLDELNSQQADDPEGANAALRDTLNDIADKDLQIRDLQRQVTATPQDSYCTILFCHTDTQCSLPPLHHTWITQQVQQPAQKQLLDTMDVICLLFAICRLIHFKLVSPSSTPSAHPSLLCGLMGIPMVATEQFCRTHCLLPLAVSKDLGLAVCLYDL